MKVIKVLEDNHGLIAICDSYKSAVWFLIQNNWINRHTEYYDKNIKDWIKLFPLARIPIDRNYSLTLSDKKRMFTYIMDNFTEQDDIWEDWIYFAEDEIWSAVPV